MCVDYDHMPAASTALPPSPVVFAYETEAEKLTINIAIQAVFCADDHLGGKL